MRAIGRFEQVLPPADHVATSPAGVRRRLRVDETSLLESVLVLRRLPGVVLQWRRVGSVPADPVDLRLAWSAPAGAVMSRPDPSPDGDVLEVALPDRPGTLTFVLVGPGRWRVDGRERSGSGEAPRLKITAELAPGASFTLMVLRTVEEERADRVLARLENLDAELRSWANDGRRDAGEFLSLAPGDPELRRALAWAGRRLPGSLVYPGGDRERRLVAGYGSGCSGGDDPVPRSAVRTAPAADAVWAGHSLVALGRHDDARDVVVELLRSLGPTESGEQASNPLISALILHLAARYVLWSGDATPLADDEGLNGGIDRVRAGIERAGIEEDPSAPPPGEGALQVAAAAALDELADALEAGHRPTAAESLREEASVLERGMDSTPPAGTGNPASRHPGILAAVLGGAGPPPSPPPDPDERSTSASTTERLLHTWASWEAGNVDAARPVWERHVLQGLRAGRGLWGKAPAGAAAGPAPEETCPWHTAATALVIAPVVFGLLGARADAAYGRLRLSPRIPATWRRFDVHRLRVADARIRLSYRRRGQRHTFVLEPTGGKLPLNLVFEPLVPTGRIAGVRVGGTAAEVDTFRRRDRLGVRLQLPVDSRREVVVEGVDEGDL